MPKIKVLKVVFGAAVAVVAARFIMYGRQKMENRKEIIDLMARTIWGEDSAGGAEGMAAVANVIKNRVKRGGWWGATYEDVILKPYQFSIWNARTVPAYANNPQFVAALKRIEKVDDTDPLFFLAQYIAAGVYDGTIEDTTGGATHYKLPSVSAAWANGREVAAHLGSHDFYVDIA